MKDKSKVALLQEILKQPKALQNITNVSNMAKMIKISDFSDSEQTGWLDPLRPVQRGLPSESGRV
jgi:hypothetical protein